MNRSELPITASLIQPTRSRLAKISRRALAPVTLVSGLRLGTHCFRGSASRLSWFCNSGGKSSWLIGAFRIGTIFCLALLSTGAIAQEKTATEDAGKEKNSEDTSVPRVGSVVVAAFEADKELRTLTGELVAVDAIMGQLILDADGKLTVITPNNLKRLEELSTPLVPTPAKELATKALKLMPAGSRSLVTDHFVVCYNTSDVYAHWNADLYEKLYKGFYRFWKEKGVDLKPPRFPLVALIFESDKDYIEYASKEFAGAQNTIGYYHQSTNRLASYDLTGIQGMMPAKAQYTRIDLINHMISRPGAERTIATIIHEACHQISFNSGLQVRLGDSPRWLSEGLAMFFESPDLTSQNGWAGIGKLNKYNFQMLVANSSTRASDLLEKLLADDKYIAESMETGYPEAWGITFYLLKNKPKEFVKYLDGIREMPTGTHSSPKERIELFRGCFGNNLAKIENDYIRFMNKQKLP